MREIWGEVHHKMNCPYPTQKELVIVADVTVDLPIEGDVFAEGSAPRKTAAKKTLPKKTARPVKKTAKAGNKKKKIIKKRAAGRTSKKAKKVAKSARR
jgi:hypothetical protein